jgi:hypothetical protein
MRPAPLSSIALSSSPNPREIRVFALERGLRSCPPYPWRAMIDDAGPTNRSRIKRAIIGVPARFRQRGWALEVSSW